MYVCYLYTTYTTHSGNDNMIETAQWEWLSDSYSTVGMITVPDSNSTVGMAVENCLEETRGPRFAIQNLGITSYFQNLGITSSFQSPCITSYFQNLGAIISDPCITSYFKGSVQ